MQALAGKSVSVLTPFSQVGSMVLLNLSVWLSPMSQTLHLYFMLSLTVAAGRADSHKFMLIQSVTCAHTFNPRSGFNALWHQCSHKSWIQRAISWQTDPMSQQLCGYVRVNWHKWDSECHLTRQHNTKTNCMGQFIIRKVKEAGPPNLISDAAWMLKTQSQREAALKVDSSCPNDFSRVLLWRSQLSDSVERGMLEICCDTLE